MMMSNNNFHGPDLPITTLPIVYTVLEASVAIIAIIGNLLVIIIFIQDRKLRKVTNFYIISLSLADLLVGAIGIPSAIMTKIGLPRSSMQLCLIMLSLLIVLCTISILNLVAVSLDRYWAILHPLDYHKRISEKTAFVIICACWILGSVIGFLPLFGWRNEYRDSCYFIPTMDYNFLLFLYFVTIVFPAFIMALFYIRIYIVVVQQLNLNKVRHLNMSEMNLSKKKWKKKKSNFIEVPNFQLEDFNDSIEQNSRENNEIYLNQNRSSFPQMNSNQSKYFSKQDNNDDDNSIANVNDLIADQYSNKAKCRPKWRSLLSIQKLSDQISNEGEKNSNDSIWMNKNQKTCKLSYSRREVKKAQKLFVIVVFFMICWLPLYTMNAIQAICRECPTLSANFLDYLIILSHINSAGSPFLYAFHMKDFRQALRRLICKGAINQRKLRDLRREELFNISGQRIHCRDLKPTRRQDQTNQNVQQSSSNDQSYQKNLHRKQCFPSSYHASMERNHKKTSYQNNQIGSMHSQFCQKSSSKN